MGIFTLIQSLDNEIFKGNDFGYEKFFDKDK